MPAAQRIYLDNAATSFPKPDAVYDAVDRYQRELGAAVGRGAYSTSVEVQRIVDRCRQKAAQLLAANDPRRIIFTCNGTDGLNLAIHGLLQPGDHVVTTVVEHNSVLRPLRTARDELNVDVTYVDSDETGRVDPNDVQRAIRRETRLVSVIHASNVTGVIQPIAEIGEIARQAGAVCLVDAAQSAGHVPIDVSALSIDLLASPGHKGMLGPEPGFSTSAKESRNNSVPCGKGEPARKAKTTPSRYRCPTSTSLAITTRRGWSVWKPG